MTDQEADKTAAKVKAPATKGDSADIMAMLKTITKLGAGGTGAMVVVILTAVVWLKDTITDSINNQVRAVVREEVKPLDDRLRKVEIEQEVNRRAQHPDK